MIPTTLQEHLVFAYYINGHGFGHATRMVEVVRHLVVHMISLGI
jgi:hypothetical protein